MEHLPVWVPELRQAEGRNPIRTGTFGLRPPILRHDLQERNEHPRHREQKPDLQKAHQLPSEELLEPLWEADLHHDHPSVEQVHRQQYNRAKQSELRQGTVRREAEGPNGAKPEFLECQQRHLYDPHSPE